MAAVRQPFDLSNMIWNVPETLAYLSRLVSPPGDLIMTGTPEGSAAAVWTGTTLLHLALVDPVRSQRRNVMSPKIDQEDSEIHNPHGEFDKPGDVVKDTILSQPEKKKALENLEQDCHTTFNLKNLKPAISMTYRSTRYLINDTLLDNFAHLPTSYLRIVS